MLEIFVYINIKQMCKILQDITLICKVLKLIKNEWRNVIVGLNFAKKKKK